MTTFYFQSYVVESNMPFNAFEVEKGYEDNEQGLIKYKADFEEWSEQLRKNKVFAIIYNKYKSHTYASIITFSRLNGMGGTSYVDFPHITLLESRYFENCYNSGTQTLRPSIINKQIECFGYDFSSFYGANLSSKELLIPTDEGYETTLSKLPISKKLKVGIYRVEITCNNDNFKMLFAFSKHNTYDNNSLAFALRHAKRFNVTVQLIQDGKPNALLYDNVIRGFDMFGYWHLRMIQVKKACPGNKLCKRLISSLHGGLTKWNTITKTALQVENEGLNIGGKTDIQHADYEILDVVFNDDCTVKYYKLLNNKQPYKYPIRIKPFLTAFGRVKVAETALKHLDSLLRIHTDGIVYSKPIEHNIVDLIPEDKTSGTIEWFNANKYKIYCPCGGSYFSHERHKHLKTCECA
jgi:hypothetical protein